MFFRLNTFFLRLNVAIVPKSTVLLEFCRHRINVGSRNSNCDHVIISAMFAVRMMKDSFVEGGFTKCGT